MCLVVVKFIEARLSLIIVDYYRKFAGVAETADISCRAKTFRGTFRPYNEQHVAWLNLNEDLQTLKAIDCGKDLNIPVATKLPKVLDYRCEIK